MKRHLSAFIVAAVMSTAAFAQSAPDAVVKAAVEGLTIQPDIITRNPGISPFALDDLLKYFRQREGDVEELLPADPASNDAAKATTIRTASDRLSFIV